MHYNYISVYLFKLLSRSGIQKLLPLVLIVSPNVAITALLKEFREERSAISVRVQQEGWGGFGPWEREAVKRIAQLPALKQHSKSVLQNETTLQRRGEKNHLSETFSSVIKQFTQACVPGRFFPSFQKAFSNANFYVRDIYIKKSIKSQSTFHPHNVHGSVYKVSV